MFTLTKIFLRNYTFKGRKIRNVKEIPRMLLPEQEQTLKKYLNDISDWYISAVGISIEDRDMKYFVAVFYKERERRLSSRIEKNKNRLVKRAETALARVAQVGLAHKVDQEVLILESKKRVQKYIDKNKLDPRKDEFLQSFEWRAARMMALRTYGSRCQCCGASPSTGAVMNVDHIKPRKIFPELALEQSNLQVLCSDCNHGKGNWDHSDWRN